eukprot:TRINITY_DN4343_c4_g1_i1.p1 TRINITY_DN4343_c4_g1~~TRINITY_DN4343_c4_g1_i1.p1  ORF type:complete len:263 (-),score=61.13 TRINITY_DN4343_c4_g1_i1:135-923(-)
MFVLSLKNGAGEEQEALSDGSKGLEKGELIRNYELPEGTKWRFGRPDYIGINELYFSDRIRNHADGSLERFAENLVMNFEVEFNNVAEAEKWQTVDLEKFKAAVNGGRPYTVKECIDMGPYNLLIGETEGYSAEANTVESSKELFRAAFPQGFAWECIEVLSGPPTVVFKWRQFGKYTGSFTDRAGVQYKGNGKRLDLLGVSIMKVNGDLKIETFDVYYNPDDLTEPLRKTLVDPNSVPILPEGADGSKNSGCSSGGGCVLM